MRTVGIIAEYNPFHTGHEYHIKKAKEAAGADYAIVVMSPDFVQRGEPAIFDKYTRTRMALLGGADLVIELPICYAAGSAEYFADGAVAMLDSLGVVDALCFGGESDDVNLFQKTAEILLEEPEEYVQMLREALKQGKTYPQARCEAMDKHIRFQIQGNETNAHKIKAADSLQKNSLSMSCFKPVNSADNITSAIKGSSDLTGSAASIARFLATPNNILGTEYCKALLKRGSLITPRPIKRQGSDYNSSSLNGTFCSATAIRNVITTCGGSKSTLSGVPELRQEHTFSCSSLSSHESARTGFHKDAALWHQVPSGYSVSRLYSDILLPYIPKRCQDLFLSAASFALTPDDFLPYLNQKLLFMDTFSSILDISSDLSDRIKSNRFKCIGKSYEEFVSELKTRQITEARIRRALLHLILDIQTEAVTDFRENGTVFYARVLGFRRSASPLLHEIKRQTQIPFVVKNSAAEKKLSETAWKMWRQDFYAAHLYRSILASRHGIAFRTEYECSPIIL